MAKAINIVGLQQIYGLMKPLFVLLCGLLMCIAPARAINAVVSHSLFYLPTGTPNEWKACTEIVWEINPKKVIWVSEQGSFTARIKTHIECSKNGSIINEDDYILESGAAKSTAEALSQHLIQLHRFLLPAGTIHITLRLTDVADTLNKFEYIDSITISEKHAETFYSDLQFLDTAYTSAASGMFHKNNKLQIPLSSAFYDENRKTLHYYAELYGSNALDAERYPLKQTIYISKRPADNTPFPKLLQQDTIQKNGTVTIYGDMDISRLMSGNYYLNIELYDVINHSICSQSILFQRYNNHAPLPDTTGKAIDDSAAKNKPVTVLDLDKTFLGKYSTKQVMSILRMLLPISDKAAAQTISGFLKRPDEVYMRYFVYNYFSNINPKDPGLAWKQFTDEIKEINRLFSDGHSNGYQSDRGIIYLKYGKPTDRFVISNENGTYPYEIWQYNTLKTNNKQMTNALFLFYKPGQGNNDMILLHSNVPTEVNNRYWRNYLYINNNGNTSANTEAEKYIGNK